MFAQKINNKIVVITFLVVVFCGMPAKGTENTQSGINRDNALEKHQQMFANYSAPQFFFGGENSRFAWLNMTGLLPHLAVHHTKTRMLPLAANPDLASWSVEYNGKSFSFDQYVMFDDRIDSIAILHNGSIVYQRYKTHTPYERHMSWSVTKVIIGAALATLEATGKVDLNKTISHYLPDYKNTAWGSISLRHVVDMTSGINCLDSEGYENNSCIFKIDSAMNIFPTPSEEPLSMSDVLKQAKAHRPPGQAIEYSSANTIIMGFVIEAVTRKPLPKVLSELIWQPMGAEADGMMLTSPFGESYGAMNARLNDIIRFGQLMLPNESFSNDSQNGILQKSYFDVLSQSNGLIFNEAMQSNLARLFNQDTPFQSRWQWDLIWQDGDMYKDGFSGQGLYVSPARNLVIAWFGTADEQFRKHQLLPMARKLSTSAFFLPAKQ